MRKIDGQQVSYTQPKRIKAFRELVYFFFKYIVIQKQIAEEDFIFDLDNMTLHNLVQD